MKHSIAAAALIVALGGVAQAQSMTEKTGVNSLLGVSPSTPDFVKQVAGSDLFEIQSSQLAKSKASGPVAGFADQMIQDHSKTSAELKRLSQNGDFKVDIPSALEGSLLKKLDALKEADSANFAGTYINDQMTVHKDAVDLFERYAKGGDNQALKAWASKTLPALRHHLEMAEGLNNAAARRQSENDGAAIGASDATGRSAYDNPAADPKVTPSNDPAFSGERRSDSPAFSGQPTRLENSTSKP